MFFTSDLHFFHQNILKWSATRPYPDVETMNDAIINTINNRVTTKDTLYILGDVSFGNVPQTCEIIQRINCQNKILIIGNHDEHMVNKLEFQQLFKSMHHILQIKHNHKKYIMCHYPILSWNAMHHGSIMLHGHSHGATDNSTVNRIDVGLDVYPNLLHISEIEQIISEKEKTCYIDRT